MSKTLLALHHRNAFSKTMKIFYLEETISDGTSLINFLSRLIELSLPKDENNMGVIPYRLGILYEGIGGHVTPLLIEYNMQVDQVDLKTITLPPRFRIYSTDSRAFDVEGGEDLRQVVLSLPTIHPLIEVYGLGLDPDKDIEKKNTIRQYSNGVCRLYSLLDLELMLRAPSLSRLFGPHIIQLSNSPHLPIRNNRTFQITCLPPNMMVYTQSINGDDDNHRKGLRHYIADNPDKANICFTLMDKSMSFGEMISKNGYLSILSGLSQTESPIAVIQRAVANGHGNSILQVGDKKITLQALFDWHVNQARKGTRQRAFMMDLFIAFYNELAEQGAYVEPEDLQANLATVLLKEGALSQFAIDGYDFGPMTELVADLPEVTEVRTVASSDESLVEDNRQLFDSIVTEFARTVIARTPHREQLLDQNCEEAFAPSPVGSRRTSPEECKYPPPPPSPSSRASAAFFSLPASSLSFRLPQHRDGENNPAVASLVRPCAKQPAHQRLYFLARDSSDSGSESESESKSESKSEAVKNNSGSYSPS